MKIQRMAVLVMIVVALSIPSFAENLTRSGEHCSNCASSSFCPMVRARLDIVFEQLKICYNNYYSRNDRLHALKVAETAYKQIKFKKTCSALLEGVDKNFAAFKFNYLQGDEDTALIHLRLVFQDLFVIYRKETGKSHG